MVGEVIDTRRPVSLMSLDQCNFLLYFKYISLCLQTSASLPTHSRSFLLQRMETITESFTTAQMERSGDCEVPSPKGHICDVTPIPKFQGTSWKRRWTECKSQRDKTPADI